MRRADALLAQLPDIGERTKAQLDEFRREPSRAKAELLLAQIAGVANHVRAITEELQRARP